MCIKPRAVTPAAQPEGEAADLEPLRRGDTLACPAVAEGEAVARALGIHLIEDPLALTLEVCRKTGQNLSSMLQDVNNRRPTEIDSINGEISAAGRKLGIPTPVNDELIRKVKDIELAY